MFRELNEQLEKYIVNEIVADWKPYKFTIDYDDGRPEDIIEYGLNAEDAKQNLFKSHKYLQEKPERVSNGELVPEDHEEVEEEFMMIHQSGDGPDASGTVKFIPTAFGYEYICSEKDFNGKGPQWSTIRTIDGIRNWFRNVLFQFGAKEVTIGNHHWNINDFPKNESKLNEFDRSLFNKEPGYYDRKFGYDKEETKEYQPGYRIAFINGDNQVFDIWPFETFGEAEDAFQKVCNEPAEKSAIVSLDKLVDGEYEQVKRFNVYSEELMEDLNEGKKREVLSDEEYAKFLLSYMYNDPSYEELLNMLPMINDDLYLEEIKTIKRPKLKSLYKKAVELKKQTNESLKDYKEIGKILQNKENGGFNIAEGNDPMLVNDEPSLKMLLQNLAKYM